MPEHVRVPIPIRTLVGFGHQGVQLTANDLTQLATDMPWNMTKLHSFSIKLPEIEWGWIENPESLARKKKTTVRVLQQRLTHYLRGRIDLGHLTLDVLEHTLNALREDNARRAHQLDNMTIGTDRYLLEMYRYLKPETLSNTRDPRDALEWAVRLQYYFDQAFRRLLKQANEPRAEDEQA